MAGPAETAGAAGAAACEVLIGIATADGLLTSGCAESLAAAIGAVAASGAQPRFQTVDFHDVATARNHICGLALARPGISHVLFIDNDMKIRGEVFRLLLGAGRPVVGAVYAKRQIDLEAYAAARAAGHPPDTARALASPFVLRHGDGRLQVREGLVQLDGIGMGCALIETALLRRVAGAGGLGRQAALPHAAGALGESVWDFFSRMPQPDGRWLSDDFAFCTRVQAVEPGAVWGYVGPGVAHQGRMDFGGAFFDRAQAMAAMAAKG
ncbi:hypothetical protein LNKW23_12750 [Paralimibaculum aggregatum]|uniref:Glycosyltransferase n=1 Tax=Paralimibaculum aggregatum TaxID=3036245 RepID=A0ABQ6LGE5_9RHOB|nr:hypothetical protein [Limibaculum sp. NKW23]GMG82062.1 hypothetical protein LNKW23_12750 [Limibaculum sp. NKW23]